MNIIISDSAKRRIQKICKHTPDSPQFLRLTISSGGCHGFSYNFLVDHQILPTDHTILHENSTIFAIDSDFLQMIDGSTVDYIEELGASFFKVTNPQASSNCGCGTSFGI